MQGIFSRRLRKRIDANTLTNGQTAKRTNKLTGRIYCGAKHGHRNVLVFGLAGCGDR